MTALFSSFSTETFNACTPFGPYAQDKRP